MSVTEKQKLDNLTGALAGLLGKLFGKGCVAALLLSVLLISGTAWAEYKAFGFGIQSCGGWTAAKEDSAQPSITAAAKMRRVGFVGWVAGYLTAYSGWVERGSGPVSESDGAGALAWVDNYCQENPLKDVAYAAWQLIYAIEAE